MFFSIKWKSCLIILICGFASAGSTYAQGQANSNQDTLVEANDYFKDLSDLFALRIFTATKWNALDIIKDDVPLQLRPNSPTSLGVGFNYKSFGLSLGVGLPKKQSSYDKYGRTKRLDIQANVYGKKIGFDAFTQIYKSYYHFNPSDFIDWNSDTFPVISDMRVASFGLNAFYLFNSDKFSYKAAFVRNQIQLKSAGSFSLGLFGHVDLARTDKGFIPSELQDSIRTDFDLKSFNTVAIGVSVGYLYTWVISKHFFLNASLTPGFGFQTISLESISGERNTAHSPAAQLTARSALGYESKHFYMGVTGSLIWRNFEYQGYELDLSTEQVKVFIGKRL